MANTVTAVVLLLIVNAFESSSALSHYETYDYYTTESRQNCVPKKSTNCHGWWWNHRCDDTYSMDCTVETVTVLRQGTKCQTGWTSYACDVPICNTSCIDGKTCTAPNTCGCVSTDDSCQSVPCSAEKNCYPGSCVSSACSCPLGFSGDNCLTILKTPDISSCKIQLYNSATSLFKEVNCEGPGVEPQTITWISEKTLSKIQVKWTTNYVHPFSMPPHQFAPHVRNSPVPIGVSETGFTVTFSGITASTDTPCTTATEETPLGTVNCDVSRDWADFGVTAVNDQTFRVDVYSKLGGHKDGAQSDTISGSNFTPQYFDGTKITRSALFKFNITT